MIWEENSHFLLFLSLYFFIKDRNIYIAVITTTIMNETIKDIQELADRNISKILNPDNRHKRIAKEISKLIEEIK